MYNQLRIKYWHLKVSLDISVYRLGDLHKVLCVRKTSATGIESFSFFLAKECFKKVDHW